MKVGFVVYGDIETTSGGFLYDRKLIENLRERGDTVRVVELPWLSYRRGLLDGLTADAERFGGFDVLCEDELAHPTLLGLNARLRRRYDTPIVSIVHHLRSSEAGSRFRNACYRAVERRYLRGIDAAICNSEFTRETVADLASLPTTVVPPAGDRFDPTLDAGSIRTRAHEGPLEVLFVGSVVPRKGLVELTKALSRLPDERFRLRVVGDPGVDPPYTERVLQVVSRLGLADRISLCGSLSDDALGEILRESHVLAIPSTHEGFGIAYLEGMSFGLPALATTGGGAREIVTHGETGCLCTPGNVGEIAGRLRDFGDDRAALADMGLAARKRYEAHPTWAESAAQVGRFLDRVVAGRRDRDANEQHECEVVRRALA